MKLLQSRRDVVTIQVSIFRRYLDSLELANETFLQAGENTVTVVEFADDECVDELFLTCQLTYLRTSRRRHGW